MNILQRPDKTPSAPYGFTAIPVETDYIIKETDRILASRKIRDRMHTAAIQGDDHDAPNQVMREILADAGDRLDREAQEASKDIDGFLSQIEVVDEIDSDLRLAGVKSSLLKEAHPREDDAVAAKSDEIKQRHLKNEFKARRRIRREPHKPDVLLTFCLLAGFACLELATGFFLYRGVEADMAAALFLSILIVSATTLAAYLTGFFGLRFALNGYHRLHRLTGIIGTVMGLFFLGYLALLVSHDRDQLAAFDPDKAFIRRVDWGVIFNPAEWLHFETLEGPAFLTILLVLGLLSLWKSYNGFSDPIPDYSTHHENWRSAANTAADSVRGLREAMRIPIEREEQLLDQELVDDKRKLKKAEALSHEAIKREQRYRDGSNIVVSIMNTVITKAQEAYLEIRSQRPAYFDRFLSVSDNRPLSVTAEEVEEKARAVAVSVMHNVDRARDLKIRLNELYVNADARLQTYLAGLEELGHRHFQHERSASNEAENRHE